MEFFLLQTVYPSPRQTSHQCSEVRVYLGLRVKGGYDVLLRHVHL